MDSVEVYTSTPRVRSPLVNHHHRERRGRPALPLHETSPAKARWLAMRLQLDVDARAAGATSTTAQANRLIDALEHFPEGVVLLEGERGLSISAVPGRVRDLRKLGVAIEGAWVRVIDDNGVLRRTRRYRLTGPVDRKALGA